MSRNAASRHPVSTRVVAVVSTFCWVFVFFGLIDLTVTLDQTAWFYDAYLLETGWGLLYTVLVGAAFVSLAVRPDLLMPVGQIALTAACLAITAVVAGSWVQLVPATLLSLNCYAFWTLAHGRGRRPVRWHLPALDPVVGTAAAILAPPSGLFAVDMVAGYRAGRPPRDDDTWGIDHWPTQAALALAVVAVAIAVAAGVRGRRSGTAVCAGSVASAAAWFGYWSVIYPDHAGSAGKAWGMALIAWACAFLVLVVWRLAVHRKPRGSTEQGWDGRPTKINLGDPES